MNSKKLIGFAIAFVSFVLLFKPAFIDIGEINPTVQLMAYLGMLAGAIVAGVLTNGGEEKSH